MWWEPNHLLEEYQFKIVDIHRYKNSTVVYHTSFKTLFYNHIIFIIQMHAGGCLNTNSYKDCCPAVFVSSYSNICAVNICSLPSLMEIIAARITTAIAC